MDTLSIINALGGIPAVAARFGVSRPSVYGWVKNGIPARLWMPVLDEAKQRGRNDITAEAVQWRPGKSGFGHVADRTTRLSENPNDSFVSDISAALTPSAA